MSEAARIADQLHRSFFGGAWHGPAVKEALAGVTAEIAAARPAGSAHSIGEIAAHLLAWIAEVNASVRGKAYESLEGDQDWPPVRGKPATEWEQCLAELERTALSLEEAVRNCPLERLHEGQRPPYELAQGILQHNAYHAGQIVLLKKLSST
jgi:uncharacterized damage-inducible protein DinB